jgi:hypothetical protein
MTVGVFGTTEFGTIDPIDGLVACACAMRGLGLGFSVHVDAAWGGYLATLFRKQDGSLRRWRKCANWVRSPRVHARRHRCARRHRLDHGRSAQARLSCLRGRRLPLPRPARDGLLAESADYVFTEAER